MFFISVNLVNLQGAGHIADALKQNRTITTIDLVRKVYLLASPYAAALFFNFLKSSLIYYLLKYGGHSYRGEITSMLRE